MVSSFHSCFAAIANISMAATSLSRSSSDSDTQMEISGVLQAEETSPAIKSLGTLFKLTEVHLWNDDSVDVRNWVLSKLDKPIHKDNLDSSNGNTCNEFLPLPEDLELSRQMNDMGLPVCFQTNKEKRSASGGKRKDPKKNNFYHCKDVENETLSYVSESEERAESAVILNDSGSNTLCSIPMLGIGDELYSGLEVNTDTLADEISNNLSHYDLAYDTGLAKYLSEKDIEMDVCERLDEYSSGSCLVDDSTCHRGKEIDEKEKDYACIEASVTAENEAEGEMLRIDVNVKIMHESLAPANLLSVELVDSDTADSSSAGVFGEWTYWDDYYMRNYFYNITTNESTWDPPPGMDNLICTKAANDLAEARVETQESIAIFPDTGECDELGNSCVLDPNISLTDKLGNDKESSALSFTESRGSDVTSDSFFEVANGKREKKIRSLKVYGKYSGTNEEVLEEISPSISKYWCQRYQLFSRFDEGIQMDEEGWFSVTPEPIATHHASRCASGTIVDCFTGVGGNAIQFAQRSQHVIAIDIDPRKLEYAQHNAAVYGVKDLIDFVIGDCILVAPMLKVDTVFLSPPWGGPDYSKVKVFDINVMLRPYNGHFLFQVAKVIAPKIVMFLPRNVDVNQLAELALSATPPWSLEVEKNYLNGKLKAITAYFNEQSA